MMITVSIALILWPGHLHRLPTYTESGPHQLGLRHHLDGPAQYPQPGHHAESRVLRQLQPRGFSSRHHSDSVPATRGWRWSGAAPGASDHLLHPLRCKLLPCKAGFPANAPDGFGTGVNPIDFGQTLAGEPFFYVVFMPDGSSQDNLGNYNSGVVYLTRPGDNIYNSSRAITVWGATGRIRGWRLAQQAGVATWVQQ